MQYQTGDIFLRSQMAVIEFAVGISTYWRTGYAFMNVQWEALRAILVVRCKIGAQLVKFRL